jgi:hypothetical protein
MLFARRPEFTKASRMLIDEPLILSLRDDPYLGAILNLISNGRESKRLRKGVYQIGHFGSSDFLRGKYEQYPELFTDDGDGYQYPGCYGVCDGIENLMDRVPLLEESPREFVITLTKVTRDQTNRGKGGGWRWHKWGQYIGTKTPTTEYLDDEPEIDQVFVYHIYERIQ